MATAQSLANPTSRGSATSVEEARGHESSSRPLSSSSSGSQSRPFIARPPFQGSPSDPVYLGYFVHESLDSEAQERIPQPGSCGGQNSWEMGRGGMDAFTPAPDSNLSKGKQRATTYNDGPATMFSVGEGRRKEYKSDWMIDEASSSAGADTWVERERVILVLGRESIRDPSRDRHLANHHAGPTPDSLSPMLYNPQYAQTLLLVALSHPSPAFTQLAAQTPSERTTYPVIQLLDMTVASKTNPSHPLPNVLEQASKLSYQWRASLRSPAPSSRTSFIGIPSRRGSTDSVSSSLPPLTPPMNSQARMSAPQISSRRSSETSDGSQTGSNAKRWSKTPSYRDSARPPVSNRASSFFGLGKSGSETRTPPASPFDAVLHIIPSASEFPPKRALQEMLQSAVLLTSTVVPILAKRDPSNSKTGPTDPSPVSLIHMIPPNSPHALPPVIENFVLSLVPKFQGMSERRLSAFVVSQAAWLHPAEGGVMSGSDVLLFGGTRVRRTSMADGSTRVKKRAYIPYWPHQGPPMTVAPNPDFTRADYSTMVPLAPPAPAEKPMAPRRKSTTPRSPPSSRPGAKHHRSGLSQVLLPSDLEDVQSLHTPELDHAPSSASSQSHEAATPRASTFGSEVSSPTLTVEDPRPPPVMPVAPRKEKKQGGGFGSFVKRFGKRN